MEERVGLGLVNKVWETGNTAKKKEEGEEKKIREKTGREKG
jgi:hypothetical protein